MADVEKLTDAAVRLKPTLDKSKSWPLAARMAVERSGIRFKPDVKRITAQVVANLSARGLLKQAIARKRGAR